MDPTPALPVKPLLMVGKIFFEKKAITKLLDRSNPILQSASASSSSSSTASTTHTHCSVGGHERVYIDSEDPTKTRYHKTDGIIFQPNASYVFSKNYDLMKWKWLDMRTIDVSIVPLNTTPGQSRHQLTQPTLPQQRQNQFHLSLLCSGPEETLISVTQRGENNVGLGVFDTYRLVAEAFALYNQRSKSTMDSSMLIPGNDSRFFAGIIAEVAYDVHLGMWRYVKVRSDKTEPNYIDTVLGVFTEQAEAIGEEELEYSLLSSANRQEQDFDHQVQKMMKKLLVWQRNGRK
jgi:hypothetical protein